MKSILSCLKATIRLLVVRFVLCVVTSIAVTACCYLNKTPFYVCLSRTCNWIYFSFFPVTCDWANHIYLQHIHCRSYVKKKNKLKTKNFQTIIHRGFFNIYNFEVTGNCSKYTLLIKHRYTNQYKVQSLG